MQPSFDRYDCLDYVIWRLEMGDVEMFALFEQVASRHQWITFKVYQEVAETLYQRLKKQLHG